MGVLGIVGSLSPKGVYRVYRPVSGKHHAIFQIARKSENGGNYTCTAFAISDTRALTAAHCIMTSKYFVEKRKETILKELDKDIADIKLGFIQCGQSPLCMLQIPMMQMQLQQIMAAREELVKAEVDQIEVRGIDGSVIETKVVPIYSSRDDAKAGDEISLRDYAIIEGDFKNFEKLPVGVDFDVKYGDKLRACGFAESRNPPACTTLTALGNINFMYKNNGYLVKGMSGGPVIDEHGFAVGINSNVQDGIVVFSPIIGILNFEI